MKCEDIFTFVCICLVHIAGAISYSIPNPIYPSEALLRGVSVSASGIVLGSAYVTSFIITPFTSYFISLLSAQKVFAIGSVLGGLGNILFGFLDKIDSSVEFFSFSLFSRTIGALGEAVVLNAAYPLVHHRGKVVGTLDFFFGVGGMAGPSVGSLLYSISGGFSLPFWTTGIIMVVLGAKMLSGKIKIKREAATTLEHSETSPWKKLWKCSGFIENIASVIFVLAPATKWHSASFEPHFIELYGISPEEVGLMYMALFVTYAIATPVSGFVIDCGFPLKWMLLVGHVVVLIGGMALGPFPGLWFLQNIPVTVVSWGLIGVGVACSYPASLLNLLQCAREAGLQESEETTSRIASVWLLFNYLGGFLSALVGGISYDLIGFSWSTTLLVIQMGIVVKFWIYFCMGNNLSSKTSVIVVLV
ncbi:MFS-type transporter SLC18B1 isoform X2 [Eurytemora carolleeae]|uniref:MFS-type transporter SLC18B1 isoform X2 n=1 Tax=Eurytemora carolleeae TaxID=1294199 RepID=UPI000C774371|nr:MFS-type transporter SLC18B1 isoform X2 [Eurytemora carolleeae]|eukprot:XP_023348758.1 MFS-type transporter SLC18B1-like isoform X2 [Eurytemora affinis]